ncbi:MAG: ABC transporter ATP-binding protein [Rhodospirillales bacterium]|nr:ABC transporter ATP-binding protein [Alphaproteobacteria bacterium]MDP7625589.1 ABC transporter ATP-binding protein [Rhodospirillales bacterium]
MSTLELKNLSKGFGGVRALDKINLSIEDASVYGLIGPNGAGKTTLFNVLTGFIKPTAGSVHFLGQDITSKKPYEIARLGIARTYQNIQLFKNMTVSENVSTAQNYRAPIGGLKTIFWAGGKGEAKLNENLEYLLDLMGLWNKRNLISMDLSYGEQRRLEIARACAMNPKLLLLDEPTAGMNEVETDQLWARIDELRRNGLDVVLVEHDMKLVMERCDHIFVLNFGQLIAQGSPSELRNNKDVIDAYLGKEED